MVGWAKTTFHDTAVGEAGCGDYLGGVAVLPSARRRGVGTALTEARIVWIDVRRTSSWYFTDAVNEASIALHARWGFQEVTRSAIIRNVQFTSGAGILFDRASISSSG